VPDEIAYEHTFRVVVSQFLDRFNFDLGTVKRSCVHFVEPDGRPGFYDLLARGEAWPLGIARFLVPTLDVLDRRAWERSLLAGYLRDLERFGAPVPAFEEAWLAYRCATICPLMVWLNNSSAWQPEATNTANAARASAAVLDHDAFALLGL